MLESFVLLEIVGTCRPREVVDVFLIEMMRAATLGIIYYVALGPGRADDPVPRDGQPHVIGSEVRKEFGRQMKLVTIPAAVFQDADFREPLGDEVVIRNGTRARERSWHVRRPLNVEIDRLARTYRFRQREFRHGLVLGIPVVRSDEAKARRDLLCRAATGWDELRRVDHDRRPFGGIAGPSGQTGERTLAHPRGTLVAPGVVIEMELDRSRWMGREVTPRDPLVALDRARRIIQPCRDRVVGVAR